MPSSPEPGRPSAHRALFISLITDAALFPPAALEMGAALAAHTRHATGPDADLVGPFLVGVPHVDDFRAALDAGAPAPPSVGVVARPGTPVERTREALHALRAETRTRLVSVDAPWAPGWRDLDPDELTINLEVGRDQQQVALDDIASAADFADVRAKFRTGATTDWVWPEPAELAEVIISTAQRYLPLVLTGGLHHVVRAEHPVAGREEPQHGLLNVLVAVHGSAGGADPRTVRELLEIRDASALADVVRGWTVPDVAAVRAAFAGYGCCDVTEPLGELRALDLLA